MSSSRRQDGAHTVIPEEYDSTDRRCCFYLYTRPLDDAVLGESDHIQLQHWALVAVFEDESIRTLEGYESGGYLTPAYTKEGPKESKNERAGKYWELIPVITSPKKLRDVCKNNRMNGSKYTAMSNNCQAWVKESARSIHSNLASSLNNYKCNGEVSMLETATKCSWASSKSSSQSIRRALVKASQSACSRKSAVHHHSS